MISSSMQYVLIMALALSEWMASNSSVQSVPALMRMLSAPPGDLWWSRRNHRHGHRQLSKQSPWMSVCGLPTLYTVYKRCSWMGWRCFSWGTVHPQWSRGASAGPSTHLIDSQVGLSAQTWGNFRRSPKIMPFAPWARRAVLTALPLPSPPLLAAILDSSMMDDRGDLDREELELVANEEGAAIDVVGEKTRPRENERPNIVPTLLSPSTTSSVVHHGDVWREWSNKCPKKSESSNWCPKESSLTIQHDLPLENSTEKNVDWLFHGSKHAHPSCTQGSAKGTKVSDYNDNQYGLDHKHEKSNAEDLACCYV